MVNLGKFAAAWAAVVVSTSAFGETRNVPSKYSTLEAALAVAQDGDEIVVRTGTYEAPAEYVISSAITIRGETGNPDDVVINASGTHRMFTLGHADAKLSGLTISGGTRTGTSDAGAGVYITAAGGTVEKCVVRNCSSNGSFAYGAGICIAAKSPGLVDSCVITNCGGQANGHFHGGLGLALDGGEARNCLITGNSLTIRFDNGNAYDIGAVYVNGGRLVNCTVVGNTCSRTPGVVATKGTVENCIIAENVRTDATDAKLVTWSGTASCFTNCVATDKINDWCFAETHPFVNSATGNFAPLLGGAAVDAAVAKDWMADAKDVLGNARVSGGAPDIGAIEYDQSVFSACVRPSVTSGKAPLEVTFAVAAAGASGGLTCTWDWGDGSSNETTDSPVFHQFAEPGVYDVQLTVSAGGASYTVPQTVTITAFGNEVRVVKDNPNAAIPYDTWDNAAATLEDAVAFAEDGCEIVISNGTYTTPAEIVVVKGVTIRSLTGDPEDVTIQASGTHRMFTLGDRNAKFSGLTIAGGRMNSFYEASGGIRIVEAGGTVEHCVISNCQCNASYSYGSGITIAANAPALVDSCVICNCGSTSAYLDGGLAIRLDGGEARNCLIKDNSIAVALTGVSHDCGAVYVNGGKLVNCTVVNNSSTKCPGVVAVKGTVENCLIAENTSTASTDAKTISWSGTASCFTNCVASDKINDWCEAEVHPFVSFKVGDYAPAPGTKAIDTGVLLDWMTEDAKDVLGNDRVSGSAPDIGAIEYDQSQFSASFSADILSGKAPLEVVFTVTPVGATAGITCFWDWDGDGTVDEETDGSTAHTFLTPTYSGVRLSVKNNATDDVIAVPQQVFITAFGDEICVVKDNPNAAIPYDNWANAAATVADAYAFAEDGCEIVISNGTHTMAAEINVLKEVTIRGFTGDPADVILQAVGTHRHFILANAAAKLSGLTLSSGTTPGHWECGGAVKITAKGGIVEKCVICDCRSSGSYGYGVGAYIEAGSSGLIDTCVFRGCRSDNANFKGGQALALDGGEARNCLFTGNSPTLAALDNDCGTVYLNGGKLSYCTVTGNSSAKCPGVVALKGTVENCLIAENVGTGATDAKTITWAGTASCFVNCVGTDKINANCEAEAHPFVNFAEGDYAPALGTKAIDRGVLQDWMDEGAKDVLGNARVSGSAPDIGAIEYDQSKFSVSFKADVLSGKAPLDVAFTVTAIGATGGLACSWDWNGDGEVDGTSDGSTTHRFDDPGVYNVRLSVKDESESPALEVSQVVKITVFGEQICVVTDNPNAAVPYDNWDNAATSLADAYDFAADGCEIVVANGTYALPAEINVVKAVTIRSLTGNPADVVLQATSGKHRIFRLGNANAKLSGLTLSGGTTPGHWEYGGCVKITAVGGTIEKCVIRDYKSGGSFCAGLGVSIEANSPGLVDSCVISNCVSSSGNLDGGLAVALAGGEMRNCLITGNSPTGAFDNDCGSVYLTGGRLVNCTVAGNSLSKCPGVVAKGGTVLNCIISENTCTADDATAKAATWAGTASCFDHCISTEKINDDCFAGENLFRDSANGDYRLPKVCERDSPARDKGVAEGWMKTGKDFFGQKRISKRYPDLGYFEYQFIAFSVIVK